MQRPLPVHVDRLTELGLSAEEAMLVARWRLGAEDSPAADVTQDRMPRPLSHALYWMALGILGYLWGIWLGELASGTSAWLSYSAGARHAWLIVASGTVYAAVLVAIGLLLWRFAASPAEITARRLWALWGVGLLVASGTLLTSHVVSAAHRLLSRSMPEEAFLQVMNAWRWAGTGRFFVMPLLLAAALAVLAVRRSRTSILG